MTKGNQEKNARLKGIAVVGDGTTDDTEAIRAGSPLHGSDATMSLEEFKSLYPEDQTPSDEPITVKPCPVIGDNLKAREPVK